MAIATYFQDLGELAQAQDFSQWRFNNIRLGISMLLGAVTIKNFMDYDNALWFFMYLSNWATMITMMTAFLGYLLTKKRATVHDYPNMLFAHHTLYTIMLLINPVVMSVFWTVIWRKHYYEDIPKWAAGDERFYWSMVITSLLNHTTPGLSAVVLMTINDCVLLVNRVKLIIGIAVTYVAFNWYSVKVKGMEPSYDFMTYDGVESWATICGIAGAAVAFYFALAKFDQRLKNRQVGARKKKH